MRSFLRFSANFSNTFLTRISCVFGKKFPLLKAMVISVVAFLPVIGFGQTISNVSVSPSTVCAGSDVTVGFIAENGTGAANHFTNSTVYQAYISTAGGGFPGAALGGNLYSAMQLSTGNSHFPGAIIHPLVVPVVTVSQTNVLCFGASTGAIDITSTGDAPFTYDWLDLPGLSNAEDRVGLAAGTYSVTVTDVNLATASLSVTITQPTAALAASTTQINVLCFGNATGSLDLTVTGGTAPYTYVWSNAASTQDISGLIAGTYNVTITDANSCTTTASATITQPTAALAASTTQINVLCFGNATGSLDLTVTGGTAPYTYVWSNAASTQDISGLIAGTYNVTITDANGCTTTASATITQPTAALAASTTQINVLCFGNATGSIYLTVTGGTAPYTYVWSNAASTQDISGLIAGTYNVTITDANSCTTTATATITQPTASLAASTTQINVLCFGNATGSLDLTVTGGTAPYTYVWSNAASTQDISGLIAGTYNVTITDANSCTTTASATITQPTAALAASTTQINVLCFGNATGSLDLTVTGGTAPYTYVWSNAASTQDISGLIAGTYNVTITDANGCTTTASATITQPTAALAASTTQINVLCFGNATGSIYLTVTGGTAPYTYLWSNAATTEDLSGLTSGTYNVTVTDANGCTTTASATITQPAAALTVSSSSNTPVCSGSTLNLSSANAGGTGLRTYSWSGPNSFSSSVQNPSISNVTTAASGTYSLIVTDAAGCSASTTTEVVVNPLILVTVTISSDAPLNTICAGAPITFTAVPVNPGSSPTYQWQRNALNVPGANGLTFSPVGLANGDVISFLLTSNATPCATGNPASSNSIQVFVNPLPATPTITAGSTTTFCAGGSVTLTSSAGTSYLWSTGANTQSITVSTSGNYTVRTTNSNGCQSALSAVTVVTVNALPATPTITAGGPTTFCAGGSVTLSSSAGTSYLWSTGATTQNINVTISGNYTVQVTNSNSCQSASSAPTTVTVNPLPATPTISAGGPLTFCAGGSVTLTSSPGNSYLWSTGETTQSIVVTTSGNYTVRVSDATPCQSSSSLATTVTVNALPTTPTISASGSTTFCIGGSVTLTSSVGTSYLWSTGATTQSIVVTTAGSYTLQISNASGCQSALSTATVVTVNALPGTPTITAGGLTTFCAGGSVTLTSSAGTSYLWSTGATTQSINVTTSGNYSVQITNSNSCQSASSAATTVTVNPLPATPTITSSGSTTFCTGGSVTLTSSTGNSYLWSTGATTQSITVSTSGNYTVQVSNATPCQSASSLPVTVTVNTLPATPTISASGSTTFCTGGSVTLTSSAGTSYLWSTGATTQSITISTSGNYTVRTTNASGCQSALSAATVVTVNTIPTITASAGGNVCVSGTTTLTATASAGTLNWYASATGGTSLGTGSPFTTPVISTTTTYYVDATSAGCTTGTRTAVVATVNARPTINSVINNSRCGNGTVTLTAIPSTGTVNWYAASIGGVSLASGNSYIPTITATTTYYVDATISGCASTGRTAVTATRYAGAPIVGNGNQAVNAPSGPASICPPVTGLVYNIPASMTVMTKDASTYYLWTLPPGFIITSGDSTSQITVSVPGPGSVIVNNQNISVIAYNPCGNSGNSRDLKVNVNTFAGVNAGPDQTVCAGTVVALAATTSGNTASVLWSPSGSGTFSDNTSLTSTFTPTAGGNITLTITTNDPTGTCSAASDQVVITVTPLPTASAGGTQTICSNGTATVSGATSTNGTISWTENGAGSITAGATTLTPTYTASAGDAGTTVTLTMTVTGNGACNTTTATATYSVVVNPLPTATAGGTQTICVNGTATVSGASSANGTISWTENGAGSITAGATTLTPTYTPAAGDVGTTVTLTMTVTSNNACGAATATATYSVVVNPLPTAAAGGTQTICVNGTATVSGASASNGTISWTENGAGSITSGATTLTPTYTAAAADAGTTVTLTMTVTSNNACGAATAIATYSVVVTPLPTASAGGTQTICSNGTAIVSGVTSANGTISWTENGAGSITAGATTLIPTYTAAAGDAGTTVTLTMTVTGTGACNTTTATATYSVVVNPLPTATAGGTQTICVNGTATVSGASSANGTISWTENGSGSITAGATTLTPTYTPAAGDAGTTVTLTMTVTSNNACGAATATATYSVVVNLLPTAAAGGTQTICVNGTATVSGASASNGTISWTENGAGSITSGATTLTPTYTAAAADAGTTVTLTMTVTSNNACGAATAIATYSVVVTPLPTASAGGTQTICSNGTATVSGATSTNGTILWTENGAGSITAGATTLTPTYTAAAGDAGTTVTLTMTVTGSGACNTTTATASYSVVVDQPISITQQPVASQTVCSSFPVSFTLSATGNVLSYRWQKDGADIIDGGFITGTGTSTLNISQTLVGDAGSYTLKITTANCGITISDPSVLTVNQSLVIDDQPDAATICEGGSTTFTVGVTGSIANYVWRRNGIPVSGGVYSGQGTNQLTITGALLGTAGNYDVVITGTSGTCNQVVSSTALLVVTPTVTITAFSPATSIRCQGAGSVTYTTTAINSTGITYSLDVSTAAFAGNSINASTGAVTYAAGWSGTTTITASAAGCNGPAATTHVVTSTATVTINAFSPATSIRCQGAGSVTYTTTANNSTGITYSLDGASVTGGNTIVATTGVVTYAAGWSGTTTITASAAGCNGPATTTHVVTITPTVTINAFAPATSTRCQGAGSVTYTTTANNTTGITYSLDVSTAAFAGNSINAGTGAVTYAAGWSGTTTITASAAGCNGPVTTTHVITITPTVTINAFTPATSTRCQGVGTVTTTTTANNSTGITYTLDATTAAFAGNSINASTGAVTYAAGWSGTTTITASAAGCNGPVTTTHVVTTTATVTINAFSPATSTRCQGAGSVTYTTTANNTTGITYSLDVSTAAFAGNSINAGTGAVTYAAGWSGTTTITASAAGCNGPVTTTHVITITPTVTINAFTPATSTRCQGVGTVTTTTTANNSTGITYTLDATTAAFAGNSINASTGAVTYAAGWSGTTTITASAAGCNGPVTTTHVVTTTATVTINAFSPATSTRCQGAGSVTYTTTANNSTGINYSLDAASITGGNTIVAATGAVTYAAGWSGTTTITASAAGCNGPVTTAHVVTISPTAVGGTLSPALKTECIGANSATITLTGNTGVVIRWEQSIDFGTIWTTALVTNSTTYTYTNLSQTTFFRAVVQSGVCVATANSTISQVIVNPAFVSTITPSPAITCIGVPITLTASGYTSTGLVINGGNFIENSPLDWGGMNGNASNNNTATDFIWGRTNGGRDYSGNTYNSTAGTGGSFFVVAGTPPTNPSMLTSPTFSTVGLSTAVLVFNEAYDLRAGSVARVEISTNGGATYTTLRTNTGVAFQGPTNGMTFLESINLNAYLGRTNLKLRFNYFGTANSVWAIDNVVITNSVSNPSGIGALNPLTYSWSPAADLNRTDSSSVIVTPTFVGDRTYTVTVTAGSCTPTTTSIVVTSNPRPTITPAASAASRCFSSIAQTTTLAYTATFLPVSYSITWNASPGNSFVAVTNATLPASPITINIPANTAPGTYTGTITVINANGCASSVGTTFTVTVNPLPTITLAATAADVCFSTSTQISTLAYSATTESPATYSLTWNAAATTAGFLAVTSATLPVSPLSINVPASAAAGTYTGTITVANGNGCVSGVGVNFTLTVNPTTVAGTITSPSVFCTTGAGTLTLSGIVGNVVQWESSIDAGATWVLLPANTTTLQTYNATAQTTLYRALVKSGNCAAAYSTIATVGLHNVWTGRISTDWNVAANWSDGLLPDNTCPDVLIPNVPNKPILSNGTFAINNLIVNAGSSLMVTGATLQVAGSITNDPGSITFSNGTLEFNGNGTQTISGSSFSGRTLMNLTVNNTSVTGLQISNAPNDTLNITGIVSFGNATADLSTGGNLTLKSTASRTANVGQLAAGNTITGDVTVERYLINGRKWRLLSAPTNDDFQSVKSSWLENGVAPASSPVGFGFLAADTRLDFATRGFDVRGNNTSVKIYNGTADTWDAVDNTTSPIKNNQGYIVFVPGDRKVLFPSSGSTTLRTKGKLYTGTQPSVTLPADRFAVVGNPYASRINFKNLNISTNAKAAYYVWDPSLGGAYGLGAFNTFAQEDPAGNPTGPYVNLLASGLYGAAGSPHDSIESGLAFMVRAFGGAGTVIFDESAKTIGSALASFTSGAPQGMRINLNLAGATPLLLDGTIVNFGDTYSNQIDQFDIKKMTTIGESVALKTGNQLQVIERRFTPVEADTLHIDMTKMTVRNYQWAIISDNMDYPGRQAFLIDRYLNTTTTLNMAGTTTVNFSIQNIPGSYASDRFKIVFKQSAAGPLPVTITSISANRNNDRTVGIQWKVQNELDLTNYEVQRSTDGRAFTSIITQDPQHNNGGAVNYETIDRGVVAGDLFYRIKANSISGLVQYSAVAKVAGLKTAYSFTVYPNPVQNKQMNIQFSAPVAGNYQITLLSNNGSRVYQQTIQLNNTTSTQSIELPYAMAGGRYQLQIQTPDGKVEQQSIIVL